MKFQLSNYQIERFLRVYIVVINELNHVYYVRVSIMVSNILDLYVKLALT
jgi:hypothetical protein